MLPSILILSLLSFTPFISAVPAVTTTTKKTTTPTTKPTTTTYSVNSYGLPIATNSAGLPIIIIEDRGVDGSPVHTPQEKRHLRPAAQDSPRRTPLILERASYLANRIMAEIARQMPAVVIPFADLADGDCADQRGGCGLNERRDANADAW